MDGGTGAMRILYVSPYPPLRDGIASYAVQDVARLRREGHDVEVLSPGPSAAHHHLDLVGPRGALALAKRVRGYDRVILQYHPDFFFPAPCPDGTRAATALALAAAFTAARDVEVVVHEVDYTHGSAGTPGALATRAMWRSVDRVVLHTVVERDQFVAAFGVPAERVSVADHGAAFVRRTRHDRTTARESLDLPLDAVVFLAIGFIQPHKGFDRAVTAFGGLGEQGAQLHVVGSLRVEDAAYVGYLEDLRAMVAATEGADLHVGYVSDELFDRWIVAADVVVLPYRHIWSSGVLERAALYHRAAVVTAVGGLTEQVQHHEDVTVVRTDAELRAALRRRVGPGGEDAAAAPWPTGGADLQRTVQAEVVARASRRRGGPVAVGTLTGSSGGRGAASSLSASVRSLPALSPPAAVSGRPGVTPVKRVVRRATSWLIDPLYWQVNALRERTIRALDAAEPSGGARPPAGSGGDGS